MEDTVHKGNFLSCTFLNLLKQKASCAQGYIFFTFEHSEVTNHLTFEMGIKNS